MGLSDAITTRDAYTYKNKIWYVNNTAVAWLNTEQTYIDTILIQSKAGIIIGIKPHQDINSLFPLEQTGTFPAS